jgi:hypothetical protein
MAGDSKDSWPAGAEAGDQVNQVSLRRIECFERLLCFQGRG